MKTYFILLTASLSIPLPSFSQLVKTVYSTDISDRENVTLRYTDSMYINGSPRVVSRRMYDSGLDEKFYTGSASRKGWRLGGDFGTDDARIDNFRLPLEANLNNTVCDTLYYDNRIILLEKSPLLQLPGFPEQVVPATDTVYDRAYGFPLSNPDIRAFNCRRGFTCTWRITDGKLFLMTVTPYIYDGKADRRPGTDSLIRRMEQAANLKFIPGNTPATWVSGELRGGTNSVRGIYGYLHKTEYLFDARKGKIKSCKITSIPTGEYENAEALARYLNEKIDSVKKYKAGILIDSNESTARRLFEKGLFATKQNKPEYYLPMFKPGQRTKFESKNSLNSQIAQALAELPEGSFYGYFTPDGKIYSMHYYDVTWSQNEGFVWLPLYPFRHDEYPQD